MRSDVEADRTAHSLPRMLAGYESSDARSALRQLILTAVPYGALWLTMLAASRDWPWLTLLLAVPTAGLLVRLFLIQHDCAHRSFLPSRAANDALGTLIGFLTLTPHACWRRLHLMHHATSGNLDRRGSGDLDTLTVSEYLALSPGRQWRYRVYRNPVVLFAIVPFVHFVVRQRWSPFGGARWLQERSSVYLTNAVIVAYTIAWSWAIGVERFLLVQGPMYLLAASVGMWLFYVQHQFEETYWDRDSRWDAVAAGMRGSSYYVLPKRLEWLTCCIGLHHIHHLSPRIPSYRLRQCLDENPVLQQAPRLTLRQSLRCTSLKLWDEESRRLVPFPRAVRAPR